MKSLSLTFLLALATSALCGTGRLPAAEPSRPNILWLVSEDNDPFLGCYGDPVVRTPTLDKLAREGLGQTGRTGQTLDEEA